MPTQVWSSKNWINTINRPIFELYVRENVPNQIRSVQSTLSTVVFECPLRFEVPKFESTQSTGQFSRYTSGKMTLTKSDQSNQHYQQWFLHDHLGLKFRNSIQHNQQSNFRAIRLGKSDTKQISSTQSTVSTVIFECPLRFKVRNIESTQSTGKFLCYMSGKTTLTKLDQSNQHYQQWFLNAHSALKFQNSNQHNQQANFHAICLEKRR